MVDASVTPALAQAIQLVRAGYFVAPVIIRRNPATGKKAPDYLGIRWHDASTQDEAVVLDWFAQHGPDLSYLVDAERSGIVGIDLDVKPDLDAVADWSVAGLPVGDMIVTTPSGGMHLYWRADPEVPVHNSQGRSLLPGVDVRGIGGHLFAPGSRVVGEDEVYEVLGGAGIVSPADLPPLHPDITARLKASTRERTPSRSVQGARHDRDWVVAQCAAQLDRVREAPAVVGTGFRDVLLGASMMLGRAVAAGIVDRDYAETRLGDAVHGVWGSVDEHDMEWIKTGLDDGEADPWTVVESPVIELASPSAPSSLSNATHEGADQPVTAPDPLDAEALYARELATEIRKERLRADARALLAAERAPAIVRLSGAAFLDAPMPEPLVPGLLYRDSLSQMFGPPGGCKSFLALDLALRIANGREWDGERLPVGEVHYVMAEGQAVNVARTHAWLAHQGLGPEGVARFHAFPMPVLLTEQGVRPYLAEVERDRPALVVLDTKNAMMDGEENSASDVAIMVRAMHEIRRAGRGTCVLLVDHTGKRDELSSRGSNGVKAAVDTQLRVSRDPDTGLVGAWVDRDKAGESGRHWTWRLDQVAPAAVLVPAERSYGDPFGGEGQWWVLDPEQVPDAVSALRGEGAAAARDVYRVLRFVGDPDGLTRAQVSAALAEGPRAHSRSTFYAGVALLAEKGITGIGSTPSKITLLVT